MRPPFDIAADLDTPVSAYLKLSPLGTRFLLESVERGEQLARYSFLGFGEAHTFLLDSHGLWIDGSRFARPQSQGQLLTSLRKALHQAPSLQPAIDGVPFQGGLVGAAGFDIVRFFERLPAREGCVGNVPEAAFVAPKSLLVFDHLTRRVALLHDGSEAERQALRRDVVECLRGPLPAAESRFGFRAPEASLTADAFKDAVKKSQRYILDGDVYQLVLSVRYSGMCDLRPFETYRALRLLNPSPYMFFCELGDFTVVGSSPEAMVKLNGMRATLRPIAGTRPRGESSLEDETHARELLGDAKENAEHIMLVDLARNDLGRVARPGTIEVDPYRAIERYSHVMHIVSGVSGTVKTDRDAFDLFAAAFPAGTLVGAPKVRAMELIDELEPVPRGFYAGTVGYFGHGGDMDQAIAIRTLVFHGDEYSFQAGAGIVADSDPEKEHQEVLAKSAVLRQALELAGEGL